VFGSPAFVLDKRLQDGDSLPKLKACSWQDVYIGPSLVHARNVPVIYNPVPLMSLHSSMWCMTTSLLPYLDLLPRCQLHFTKSCMRQLNGYTLWSWTAP